MPTSLPSAASNLKSIHLLRSLLREATYLPDANARQYFRRYIVARFRAYQLPRREGQHVETRAAENYLQKHRVILGRMNQMQHAANKGLNYLRRANSGELRCLQAVLRHTYGRVGERRYTLLEMLLVPEVGSVSDGRNGLSPLQSLYHSENRYLSVFDAPKRKSETHYIVPISNRYSRLRAVIKSQVSNGIHLKHAIKRPELVTPIHNIWHRPMPIRRARNNVKRWYAETMSRLLPPLPNAEWDTLQALAHRKTNISTVKRRVPACLTGSEDREAQRLDKVVSAAISLDKQSLPARYAGLRHGHNITARFMSRMYIKLLRLCCKVDWDEQRKKWLVTWGDGRLFAAFHAQSDSHADELFAGVDANGRKLKASRELASRLPKQTLRRDQFESTLGSHG